VRDGPYDDFCPTWPVAPIVYSDVLASRWLARDLR